MAGIVDELRRGKKRREDEDLTSEAPAAPKQKFSEAFAAARKAGLKSFEWEGGEYHTKLAEEAAAEPAPAATPPATPPVDNGRDIFGNAKEADYRANTPVMVRPGMEKQYLEQNRPEEMSRLQRAEKALAEDRIKQGAANYDRQMVRQLGDEATAQVAIERELERNGPDSAAMYGVDQAQRMLGKGLETVGGATGMQGVEAAGRQYAESQDKDIAAGGYQPDPTPIRETFEKEGFLSALSLAGTRIAENAAPSGFTLAGATAAAVAATFSAPAAAVLGGATVAGSMLLNTGDVKSELEEKGVTGDDKVTLGVGLLVGMLDTFGASKVIPKDALTKMAGSEVVAALLKAGYPAAGQAVAKAIGKKITWEVGTENLQEGMSVARTAAAGGEYTQQELFDRAIDTTVVAIGLGGAGATVSTGMEVNSAIANGGIEAGRAEQAKEKALGEWDRAFHPKPRGEATILPHVDNIDRRGDPNAAATNATLDAALAEVQGRIEPTVTDEYNRPSRIPEPTVEPTEPSFDGALQEDPTLGGAIEPQITDQAPAVSDIAETALQNVPTEPAFSDTAGLEQLQEADTGPSFEGEQTVLPEVTGEPQMGESVAPGETPMQRLEAALAGRQEPGFDGVAPTLSDPAGITEPSVPTEETFAPELDRTEPTLAAEVDAAANEAATSPENDLPEPTEAQKKSGKYTKGHLTLQGIKISIENPRGSERNGTDSDGETWSVTMPHHYGYVDKTEGADGDQVDVYVGPNPASTQVFVVDQIDAATGEFDEHKVMMGFDSQEEAEEGYRAGFSDGQGAARMGSVTPMDVDGFKTWLQHGNTALPLDADNVVVSATNAAATATPIGEARVRQSDPDQEVLDAVAKRAADAAARARPDARKRLEAVAAKFVGITVVPRESLWDGSTPGRMERGDVEFLDRLGELSGVRFVYVKAPHMGGEQFVLPGTNRVVYVDVSKPNTIAAVISAGHEITHIALHTLRNSADPTDRALAATVDRLMAENLKGRRLAYYSRYFGRTKGAGKESVPVLREEATSDIGGNAHADPAFWERVLEAIDAAHGATGVRKFINAMKKALTQLASLVKGRGFQEGYATNGAKVREAIIQALVQYYVNHGAGATLAQTKASLAMPVARTSKRRTLDAPAERLTMSTTVPKTTTQGVVTDAGYTEQWVIDSDDIKASKKHTASLVAAVRRYNAFQLSGRSGQVLDQLRAQVTENLLWLHDLVPADTRARAKLWYDGANRIANDWAARTGHTPRQVAGVLAVLSPQMDWFKNVSLGERILNIWTNHNHEAWTPAMTAWVESYVAASKDVKEMTDRKRLLKTAKRLEGKTLAELGTDMDQAAFVRVFDETYFERGYRVVTPEGGFGEYATSAEDEKTGEIKDAMVTWGSFREISKAVSILKDGSARNVHEKLGNEHKVRNFYNNIVKPGSASGHVTIDTHAIAAATLKSLSGADIEVLHNFGGTQKGTPGAGENKMTGASGTYGLFADAYRDAAAARDILPREMQSITWEAVRALFPAGIKSALKAPVSKVWDRYQSGEITRAQAQEEVLALSKGAEGMQPFAWENTPAGNFAADGGTSFDTLISSNPENRKARTVPPRDTKDKIAINLSVATDKIPGLKALYADAQNGNTEAQVLLQDVALANLRHLLRGTSAKVKATRTTGVFGGKTEPSYSAIVTFTYTDRGAVLAALKKFADNFMQDQVHVQQPTKDAVGTTYEDGSYSTPVYRWKLATPLTRKQIDRVIAESGLYGLNTGADFIEAYYVGDVTDEAARQEFDDSIAAADRLLGKATGGVGRQAARLWAYGDRGDGAIGWPGVDGVVSAEPSFAPETTQRVASYLNGGRKVKAFDHKAIDEAQRNTQETIRAVFDQLPDNDLNRSIVKRAYNAAANELKRQYQAMPIRVELYEGKEPYANSDEMRSDLANNNHPYVYATTPSTFGPEGVDFTGHPLLEQSGLTDVNERPMLVNDVLRAVHDYFAHNLSATQFGPIGEEAAWRNHMSVTADPLARWAITAETRAQNSWVNFRPGVAAMTKAERGFARQKAALLPLEFTLTGDRTIDAPVKKLAATLGKGVENGSAPKDWKAQAEATRAAEVDPSEVVVVRTSPRRSPPPKKTVKAYKLFRMDKRKPGQIFPLFVDANTPVPVGTWLDADEGEMKGDKVKSKIGPLAYRPGWHAGDVPVATHIGSKSEGSLTAPDLRSDNHVWAEVEMAADVDWQTVADSRARRNKAGDVIANTAHITDQLPKDGFYRYKTNANMTGSWLIGGAMRVTRLLGDAEVEAINAEAGVADLPRANALDLDSYGFDVRRSPPRRADFAWAKVSETPNGPAYQGQDFVLDPVKAVNTSDEFATDGMVALGAMGHLAQVTEGAEPYLFKILDRYGRTVGELMADVKDGTLVAIHDIETYTTGKGLGTKVVAHIAANTTDPVRVIDIIKQSETFWNKFGADNYDPYHNATLDWAGVRQHLDQRQAADEGSGAGLADLAASPSDAGFDVSEASAEDVALYFRRSPARPDAADGRRAGGRAADADGNGNLPGRPVQEHAVQVTGVHYSQEPRTVLDSSKHGSGMPGAEAERLADWSATPEQRHRIYFYVDEGKGIKPEVGVGPHPHVVPLDNLYPANTDPLNLRQVALAQTAVPSLTGNYFEQAAMAAGFDGLYYPGAFGDQGGAILLGEHKIDVKRSPSRQPIEELRAKVDALKAMTNDERDEIDPYDFGYRAYALWEAEKMMPKKEGTMKMVNENNSFALWQDADAVANVNGEAWLATKVEDPDDDNDEGLTVWHFEAPDDSGVGYTTDWADKADAIEQFKSALEAGSVKFDVKRTTPRKTAEELRADHAKMFGGDDQQAQSYVNSWLQGLADDGTAATRGSVSWETTAEKSAALAKRLGWSIEATIDALETGSVEIDGVAVPASQLLGASVDVANLAVAKLLDNADAPDFAQQLASTINLMVATRGNLSEIGRALNYAGAMQRNPGRGAMQRATDSIEALDQALATGNEVAGVVPEEMTPTERELFGKYNEGLRDIIDAEEKAAEIQEEIAEAEADNVRVKGLRDEAMQNLRKARGDLTAANADLRDAEAKRAGAVDRTPSPYDIAQAEGKARQAEKETEKAKEWEKVVKDRLKAAKERLARAQDQLQKAQDNPTDPAELKRMEQKARMAEAEANLATSAMKEAQRKLREAESRFNAAQKKEAEAKAKAPSAYDISQAQGAARRAEQAADKAMADLKAARKELAKANARLRAAQKRALEAGDRLLGIKAKVAAMKKPQFVGKGGVTMQDIIAAVGGQKGLQRIQRAIMHGQKVDVGQVNQFFQGIANNIYQMKKEAVDQKGLWGAFQKYTGMWLEQFRAFVLTGIFTHGVNILSNAIFQPLDMLVTRAIKEALPGGAGAPAHYRALAQAVVQTMSDIKAAAVFGMTQEFPAAHFEALLKANPDTRQELLDLGGNKWMDQHGGALPGTYGKTVRTVGFSPLGAMDLIFKLVPYRYSINLQKAQNPGAPVDYAKAISVAENTVFQNKLDKVTAMLPQVVKFAPPIGFLLPFIKTLVNLIKRALDLDLVFGTVKNIDHLRGTHGKDAQSYALAKAAVAAAFGLVVLALHGDGDDDEDSRLSGMGPLDPNEKKLWLANNKQIGLKITEALTVSLVRMEPFASGAALTIAEKEAWDLATEGEFKAAGWKLVEALGQLVVGKSFMKAPSEALQAALDVEGHGDRFLERQGTSMLLGALIPNFFPQLGDMTDEWKRDPVTFMDQLKRKLPGLREELDPMLDYAGEPLKEPRFKNPLPVPVTHNADRDEVAAWLLGRGVPLQAQPKGLKADEETNARLPLELRQMILQKRHADLTKAMYRSGGYVPNPAKPGATPEEKAGRLQEKAILEKKARENANEAKSDATELTGRYRRAYGLDDL